MTSSNVQRKVNDGVAPVGKKNRTQMKYGPKQGNRENGNFINGLMTKILQKLENRFIYQN